MLAVVSSAVGNLSQHRGGRLPARILSAENSTWIVQDADTKSDIPSAEKRTGRKAKKKTMIFF